MSNIPPPTRWTLVARHPIRPAVRQELFRLPAGALLVARDLRGFDGRLLSELVVVSRVPELTDAAPVERRPAARPARRAAGRLLGRVRARLGR